MQAQQEKGTAGKTLSNTLGIVLIILGMLFLLLNFSVLPLIGLILGFLSILVGIFFFMRAHRMPAR